MAEILGFWVEQRMICVKPENVQKNFIDKLDSLRKGLVVRFPKYDMQNFTKEISRLAHYHYNKKKFMVIGQTKELYDFLIENSYNPYTVYRWLLLERVPEDIRYSDQGE